MSIADFERQVRDEEEPKETHADKIIEFLTYNRGERFKASEIGRDLGLTGGIYKELQRLNDGGDIFKDGKNYYIPAEAKNCDPFEMAANAFNIDFPLEIGNYARVAQGDVVLVAGTKNSGKSAFLAETAILNKDRQKINYVVTENMRKIAERYIKWGYSRAEVMKNMMFKDARDRRYDAVIDPNCINILDYYNPSDGDYTKVAKEIEMMAKRLETGLLVLGIQKRKGAEFARGNELSEELSQLSIHLQDEAKTGEDRLGRALLRMIKEEGAIKGGTGKSVQYSFSSYDSGSRMEQVGYWGWKK
ncbi:MAG: hypothetical protein C0399_03465 [Syntrophus sp. (in: bacteria)]|nr:hypothetical protein [Syntrophus sp. (in: bacteria)]